MRAALMTLAATLISAPAWAAPGLWQWQPMVMADMQAMTSDQLASHVGDWIYAADGSIIGSLEKLSGDQASVHVSTFFKPDDQPVTLPVQDLGVIHDKLVVHGTSFAQVAP
jgi:hypothetical protein